MLVSFIRGYIASLMRTPYDFAKCVVSDYFGIFIDIANGRLLDALATAAELAIAAYNCRGKW
ncbi:hypothetical protein HCC65_08895 [Streptococcus suis]|nr:hypothetical protein [Streptococcus suis]HEM5969779.1 hypothetical protein [Streptococcus suis]HEM6087276.1 hypothetical protein [Streptococcus suis]